MSDDLEVKKFQDILRSLVKDGFIVYCGAGISIPAPSCAPSWWTLTEEILNAFFDRIPEDWGLPKDIMIKDPNKKPEEVFEDFANMLDIRLFKIFSALNVTEPNANHLILAKLAKLGFLKGCITTNFDVFIERALKSEGVEYDLLVDNNEYSEFYQQFAACSDLSKFILCKIHGTIERPDTIVSVASAYKTSKGFSIPKAQLITALLQQYPVLFLGYSGFDFEHLNYRRFWERIGPQVKSIYWNRRPNEEGGVNFREIFSTCWEVFQMCAGELPMDLIKALESTFPVYFPSNKIKIVDSQLNNQYYQKALQKRVEFFTEWSQEIPEAHTLGLVLSQAYQFSQRYKELLKDSSEAAEDRDAPTFQNVNTVQDLATKLGNGEITQAQYQEEVQNYMLQIRLTYLRKSWKPRIMDILKNNEIPGITDDMMKRDQFLGYLMAFSSFELDEAIKNSIDVMERYAESLSREDDEGKIDATIIGFLPTMMHPNKSLWEPYYEKMQMVKDKLLKGEIDLDAAQNQVQAINTEYNNHKMGMTIDYQTLFNKLLQIIYQSPNDSVFQEGCEALVLTINSIATYLYSDLARDPEFQAAYQIVATDIHDKKMLSSDKITAIYNKIRAPFQDILERAESIGHNCISQVLIEATILRIWGMCIQYIDVNQMKTYTKNWDTGEYPFRFTNPTLYKFTKEQVMPWVETAFTSLNSRFLQKVLGFLVPFAESGNDFEFVKKITFKSLELSEGVVTEATPMDIPACLAGFYEKSGDISTALKYYLLALDAIKTALPPLWQDMITYRSAYLTVEVGEHSTDVMKQALRIINQYHPTFRGNAGILNMPARQKSLEFANNLAIQLNYADATDAIEAIDK